VVLIFNLNEAGATSGIAVFFFVDRHHVHLR
jgi:hypothetical protein